MEETEIDPIESTEEFIKENFNSDNPVLLLNSLKITKLYPNFVVKLKKYLLDLSKKEFTEDEIHQIIFANPRFLYDFLDIEKIYINIMGLEDKWYYSIEKVKQGTDFKTRVLAEHDAIMESIKILDKSK